MTRLAELTQLRHCPEERPFGDKGAVIGDRDGYLIAAGPVSGSSNERVGLSILVRFTGLEEPEVLKPKLEQLSKDRAWKMKTEVYPLEALWTWKYSFTPKPEAVAERIEAMLTAVKEVAKPLDGRCEVCHMVSPPEITVEYQMLSYQCSGCKERLRLEAEAAQREYDAVPGKSARGLILGLVAALVGGVAWAWVASIWGVGTVWTTMVIGMLVSVAVVYGTEKASGTERKLSLALAAVGGTAACVLYYRSVPQSLGAIIVLLSAVGLALLGAYFTFPSLELRFYGRWLNSKNESSSEQDRPANP
jgi:hypothetical protein